MEVIDDVVSDESTEIEETDSTENPETEATEIASEDEQVSETPLEGESSYEPNYQFKVLDNEMEFDERLRGVIKDKETEDYVRDLYTRAHGLDSYKTKLQAKDQELGDISSKYKEAETYLESVKQGISNLEELSKKDFGSFQKRLDIPDDQILDRAREILELREKPAHEQERYRQLEQDRINYQKAQSQIQSMTEQNRQMAQRQHQFEMDQAMMQPEVQSFQKVFDERLGEGAFKRHVDQYGSNEYHSGRYVQPVEAVMSVYKQYKELFPSTDQATPQPAPQQTQAKAPPPPPKNLGGGVNQTVTGNKFRSLDDIRKAASQMGYGS